MVELSKTPQQRTNAAPPSPHPLKKGKQKPKLKYIE